MNICVNLRTNVGAMHNYERRSFLWGEWLVRLIPKRTQECAHTHHTPHTLLNTHAHKRKHPHTHTKQTQTQARRAMHKGSKKAPAHHTRQELGAHYRGPPTHVVCSTGATGAAAHPRQHNHLFPLNSHQQQQQQQQQQALKHGVSQQLPLQIVRGESDAGGEEGLRRGEGGGVEEAAQEVSEVGALCCVVMSRVGQNHTYTVYMQYFWQGNHQIYGHIR